MPKFLPEMTMRLPTAGDAFEIDAMNGSEVCVFGRAATGISRSFVKNEGSDRFISVPTKTSPSETFAGSMTLISLSVHAIYELAVSLLPANST